MPLTEQVRKSRRGGYALGLLLAGNSLLLGYATRAELGAVPTIPAETASSEEEIGEHVEDNSFSANDLASAFESEIPPAGTSPSQETAVAHEKPLPPTIPAQTEPEVPHVAGLAPEKQPIQGNPSPGKQDLTGRLHLSNPASNRGAVHFVLDDSIKTLLPGEECEFSDASKWTIGFDRGTAAGPWEASLKPGNYTFRVDQNGWRLDTQSP